MVRINKTRLSQDEVKRLSHRLDSLLGKLDQKKTSVLLNELLGYEERLGMTKRLSALIMLLEGYSAYKISKTLKLSQSTVATIARKLKNGEFAGTVILLHKNKIEYRSIVRILESILTVGGLMPRRYGMDRYGLLRE